MNGITQKSVAVGRRYMVKIGSRIAEVEVVGVQTAPNWRCHVRTLDTNRTIVVRGVQRLRPIRRDAPRSAEQARVANEGFFVLRQHWSGQGATTSVVWHLLSGEDRVSPVPAVSNEVRRFPTREAAEACLSALRQQHDLYVAYVRWEAVRKAQEEVAEMQAAVRHVSRMLGSFFR